MFTEFLQRLTGVAKAPEGQLPEPDAKLALAALMVRVAKSDNLYQVSEISLIDNYLAQHFGLGPVEAAKMRAKAEKLEHQAPPTGTFTGLIRDSVRYTERLEVLVALWAVSMADGVKRAEEAEVVARTAAALGITDEDAAEVAARYAP